ncbi:hypothetical protein BU26DRAFT_488467 [Trematosphaeria pertusa]|uniref:Uncharacterized protein n=1 Tax=Trematosphaeria pertusa TaxID=390896 RepID=A0A6A6I5L3_9PLEO|nr:uncharacterized protein BU26DRAFT_488467 [Trematosphaeria pertusa]KAF2245815.1 hypothetical protein BU26DRAFT_488467 [Trematosphaeria pertusa]
MQYQTLALAALLACATALPSLQKRDQQTWDENGNLKLTFSKDTVMLGDVTIDDIFAKLGEVCHESGQCETNDIELDGIIWSSNDQTEIKVTLGPDGEYPTWIRNGLLDGLKAAVQTVAKCEETTYHNSCGFSPYYCPAKDSKHMQCEVPKYWGINFQAKGEENAAPPNLATNMKVERVGASPLCEDILTGLGAVAGAVHGVGGGIFTLLTFACQ